MLEIFISRNRYTTFLVSEIEDEAIITIVRKQYFQVMPRTTGKVSFVAQTGHADGE